MQCTAPRYESRGQFNFVQCKMLSHQLTQNRQTDSVVGRPFHKAYWHEEFKCWCFHGKLSPTANYGHLWLQKEGKISSLFPGASTQPDCQPWQHYRGNKNQKQQKYSSKKAAVSKLYTHKISTCKNHLGPILKIKIKANITELREI